MRWGWRFGADPEEGGQRWFRENGTRSQPLSRPQWSSPVSASVSILATMELTSLGHRLGLSLLTGRCWLIGGFGDFFDGSGGHVLEFLWVFELKFMLWRNVFDWWGGGGLIVSVSGGGIWVWLCWSGFDCVDLGLLRLVSWSRFDLDWFVNWLYEFDLLRIQYWLC